MGLWTGVGRPCAGGGRLIPAGDETPAYNTNLDPITPISRFIASIRRSPPVSSPPVGHHGGVARPKRAAPSFRSCFPVHFLLKIPVFIDRKSTQMDANWSLTASKTENPTRMNTDGHGLGFLTLKIVLRRLNPVMSSGVCPLQAGSRHLGLATASAAG